MQLLQRFFGDISARIFIIAFLASWALVLIPVAISLFFKKNTFPVSAADRHYRLFCERLSRIGLARASGEAPGDFATRVAASTPANAEQVWYITRLYTRMAYEGGGGEDQGLLKLFTGAVAGFKPERGHGGEEEQNVITGHRKSWLGVRKGRYLN